MQGISKKCTFLLFLLTAGICYVSVGVAEDVNDIAGKKGKASEYQLDDRPDPFLPFFTKVSRQPNLDDPPIDTYCDGALPFEPGQLQIVVVMSTPIGWKALAEDATGKGYILSEGMLIGRRCGRITKIENGRVLITETSTTKAGRTRTKEIIMRLKKEGDK